MKAKNDSAPLRPGLQQFKVSTRRDGGPTVSADVRPIDPQHVSVTVKGVGTAVLTASGKMSGRSYFTGTVPNSQLRIEYSVPSRGNERVLGPAAGLTLYKGDNTATSYSEVKGK
jgi:hypothetical protein